MEDYPRTIEEFEAKFSSEETCPVPVALAGRVSVSLL
jgi:hypothetical protein